MAQEKNVPIHPPTLWANLYFYTKVPYKVNGATHEKEPMGRVDSILFCPRTFDDQIQEAVIGTPVRGGGP